MNLDTWLTAAPQRREHEDYGCKNCEDFCDRCHEYEIDMVDECDACREVYLNVYGINVKFAFYHEFEDAVPPEPSYLIERSYRKGFVEGGNIGIKELDDAEIPYPPTPSYDQWVKNGRQVYRG